MNNFDNLKVSTQTFTIHTNIRKLNLKNVKDRIRVGTTTNSSFPNRLISLHFNGKNEGSSPHPKNFNNCISIKTRVEPFSEEERCNNQSHIIDMKIFNNGVFQLAGCKKFDHAIRALLEVWAALRILYQQDKHLNKSEEDMILLFQNTKDDDELEAFCVSAMRNVYFNLGFAIDREMLRDYIISHQKTFDLSFLGGVTAEDNAILVASPVNGFTGVQLYFPVHNMCDLIIHKINFFKPHDEICYFDDILTIPLPDYTDELVKLSDLWKIKPELKEKQKLKKNVSVSVAVFQTGNTLMSGVDEMFQKPIFEWFIKLIDKIQHHLIVKKEIKTFSEFILAPRKIKLKNSIFIPN
jgi:hypothetical protein